MLDENPYFGGHPATSRPYGKDWRRSLKGGQKADDSTFSEFCREEPGWCLDYTQMFQDTHSHLFRIAGSKVFQDLATVSVYKSSSTLKAVPTSS